MMKLKVDLVNMFHVSVDRRTPIPTVKKRKAKRGFQWHGANGKCSNAKVSLTVLKEFSHKCFSSFSCPLT